MSSCDEIRILKVIVFISSIVDLCLCAIEAVFRARSLRATLKRTVGFDCITSLEDFLTGELPNHPTRIFLEEPIECLNQSRFSREFWITAQPYSRSATLKRTDTLRVRPFGPPCSAGVIYSVRVGNSNRRETRTPSDFQITVVFG